MIEFNPQVFAVQIVTFVLGMGAIWFIYLKPLGAHLKARKKGIAEDLKSAEAARAEGQQLHAQLKAERLQMAQENHRLMEKTKADAEAFRADLMKKAGEEHAALLQAGQQQLDQERREAIRQIREEAASLVVLATQKLMETKGDEAADLERARSFVKTIEISNN